MGLFGKKKLTLEDIVEGIGQLSEEELDSLKATLNGGADGFNEEAEEAPAEEVSEEAPAEEIPSEENAEETADETEEETAEEAAETAAEEADAEEQTAEEPPAEETAEESAEDGGELADLRAKIDELTKTVEALAARISADAENGEAEEEEGAEFGIGQGSVGADVPDESDVEKCRTKYFNF